MHMPISALFPNSHAAPRDRQHLSSEACSERVAAGVAEFSVASESWGMAAAQAADNVGILAAEVYFPSTYVSPRHERGECVANRPALDPWKTRP